MQDAGISPRPETTVKPGMSLGTLGMVWTLASIAAFFISLVVAYAFILPTRPPTDRVAMPSIFWASTLLLFVSSAAFQWARHLLLRARLADYRLWLRITTAIGYLFVILQLAGWEQLLARKVAMVANPYGNMYVVFSGIHAVHVLGGLIGLHWLMRKAAVLTPDGGEQPLRRHRQAARLTAMYWHFLGALWVGLFAFLLGWS